jgi:hypothetical protein
MKSIDIIFVMNFFSDDLFRAAPYRLMLGLNKDVPWYYRSFIYRVS